MGFEDLMERRGAKKRREKKREILRNGGVIL